MFLDIVSRSPRETQALARLFAKEILKRFLRTRRALVIGLTGPLGSGKTTFLQGFARGLGVRARPPSPTFLIMRPYPLPARKGVLWHCDCYRIKKGGELISLGLGGILRDPQNIIVVEWGEKVKRLLPRKVFWLTFAFAPVAAWRRIIIEGNHSSIHARRSP